MVNPGEIRVRIVLYQRQILLPPSPVGLVDVHKQGVFGQKLLAKRFAVAVPQQFSAKDALERALKHAPIVHPDGVI